MGDANTRREGNAGDIADIHTPFGQEAFEAVSAPRAYVAEAEPWEAYDEVDVP